MAVGLFAVPPFSFRSDELFLWEIPRRVYWNPLYADEKRHADSPVASHSCSIPPKPHAVFVYSAHFNKKRWSDAQIPSSAFALFTGKA